ncbi:hypothetical protein GF358_01485 [Candidatus Woesearchaeota archaeon]|nr:hypothetical protein [Candidatus Woesearchaeota archaeon]
MVISTLKESIEKIILEASKTACLDFHDSKILYEEAMDMIGQRNRNRKIQGKKPLELKDILVNAFKPIKDRKMGYNYEFAQAYYATKEYTKAIDYLRKAAKQSIGPPFPKVVALLVRTSQKLAFQTAEQKYWTEAENKCQKVIDRTRGHSELSEWMIRELSDIYQTRGKTAKAQELLETHRRKYPALNLYLAEIHVKKEKQNKAIENITKFLEENPDKWNFIEDNKTLNSLESIGAYKLLKTKYQPKTDKKGEKAAVSLWNTKGIFSRAA